MSQQPDRSERAIFLAALEENSPARREALIERACAGHPDLLARVRALLATHDESRGPLDEPPPGLGDDQTMQFAVGERPGAQIGPYKLLQQIGEGGFGVVYAAEQQSPIRRKVALKLVKAGMDTREVIARFAVERQALAMMDHPNIAQVLGAGATDQGRPYFVMELVRGVPVTEYCDMHNLTMRQRLDLFVEVCQAVQHAHQKGIIHRDIKPSNILVALHDGRPVPKIIDFGVSKALNQQLTEKTLFTAYGQMIGTPQYMSPEQAEMSGLDVDTRSDVYSLGVLLYEMLTGTTPLDSKRLRGVGYAEMQRLIQEDEPPKPSARVSTLGQQATIVARHRSLDARRLREQLQGELDWIVMRAIEKERGRRYETASALAEDVERYLRDEAVSACPPSAVYRFRKVIRRNRGLLAIATTVGGLLVGVIVLNTVLAFRAMRAEQLEANRLVNERAAREAADMARRSEGALRDVVLRERDAAVAAEQEAAHQREMAVAAEQQAEENFRQARRAVDQYLATIRESPLLAESNTRPLRRQLLESAREFYQAIVDKAATDQELSPDVAAAHLRRGQILEELGDPAAARTAYRAARSQLEQLAPEPTHAELRIEWAEASLAVGEWEQAIELADAVLEADSTHAVARRLLHRAHLAAAQRQVAAGRTAAARTHFASAQTALEPLTSDDESTAAAADLSAMAALQLAISLFHEQQQDLVAALAAVRGAMEAAEAARGLEPQTARYGELAAISHLRGARLLVSVAQPEEALSAYRRSVATWSKLTFEHPSLPHFKAEFMRTSRELAAFQRTLHRIEDAAVTERRAEQFLAELPRGLGEDDYQLAVIHAQLAAPPAEGEPALPAAEEAKRGDHAARAVELLRQAIESGYRPPADLANDPLLAPLATRDDFRRLAAARVPAVAAAAGTEQPTFDGTHTRDIELRLITVAGLRGIADAHRELQQLEQAAMVLEQCFVRLEELAREYPEDRLAVSAERGLTHYSMGYVHWHARRYPPAYEAWNAGFELLRQAHAEATDPRRQELASAISHEELDLVNVYGRVGAWQEAARHRARYIAFDRFTTGAWEARHSILTLVADAGESYEDACRFMLERHADDDSTHTAWMLMFGPQTVIDPAGIVEVARRNPGATRPNTFASHMLGDSQRRAGQGEDVLQGLGHSKRELFERALVLQRLGETDAARFALEMGDLAHAASARDWLASSDLELPGGPWASRDYWWEACHDQVWRQRAWEAVLGERPRDPWSAMFEARGHLLVGNTTAAAAAFERAVEQTPDDVLVWITRAECRAALGQFAEAEQDFARALTLEPDNPECWIARGKFFLERGLDARGDHDYRRAAELSADDLDLFLRTGVWGVGPFPAAMTQSFEPEQQPHPARDVAGSDRRDDQDVELRRWKRVPVSYEYTDRGRVSLEAVTKGTTDVSAYALAVVYSPQPRTASLMIASQHHRRVWMNDVCIYDNPVASQGFEELEWVPLSLREGRNTIVVRISTNNTQSSFLLRLSDGPLERARHANRVMHWEQAAAEFEKIAPRALVKDGHYWSMYCECLGASRNHDHYAAAADTVYRLRRSARERGSFWELLRAGTMLPTDRFKPNELSSMLKEYPETTIPWQQIARGRALYRAAEFAEAIDYYGRLTDLAGDVEVMAVTAMAHHQLGQAAEANEWCQRALQQFQDLVAAALDKPGFTSTAPVISARQWATLQESMQLIRGEELAADPTCRQLMQKVDAELSAIRPELADHDRALLFQPQEARLWMARGQRLAELARWEEAEADFDQATKLKADDPFIWLAITRYWLAREMVAQASAACVRALDADRTRQWTQLVRQLFTSHEALLPAVLETRPRDVELWSLRGELLCEADRWGEAAQVWQRLIELGEETHLMWYRLALLQAGAGDIAAQGETCREMLQRFGVTESAEAANFTAWSCVVTPGALADYAPAESLARQFVDANVALPIAHTTMGAVWLRAGRPEAAIAALTLADELNDPDDATSTTSSAYAWFLLVMAHAQLGQPDTARHWYDRAMHWMAEVQREQSLGRQPAWAWNRRLTLSLLQREATQVLQSATAGRPTLP